MQTTTLSENRPNRPASSHILVREGSRYFLLNLNDVAWLRWKDKRLTLVCEGEPFEVECNRAQLALRLPKNQFFALGPNHYLNLRRVIGVEPKYNKQLSLVLSGVNQPLLLSQDQSARFISEYSL